MVDTGNYRRGPDSVVLSDERIGALYGRRVVPIRLNREVVHKDGNRKAKFRYNHKLNCWQSGKSLIP